MSDYFETVSADPKVAACEDRSHPTDRVLDCSPDPVLSHDGGRTSQACRTCQCGRATNGSHVFGCTAGRGPLISPAMKMDYAQAIHTEVDRAVTEAQVKAHDDFCTEHGLTDEQRAALLSWRG